MKILEMGVEIHANEVFCLFKKMLAKLFILAIILSNVAISQVEADSGSFFSKLKTQFNKAKEKVASMFDKITSILTSNDDTGNSGGGHLSSAPGCGITKYMEDDLPSSGIVKALPIIGGSNAKLNQVPWLVRISNWDDGSFIFSCGGTIIHKRAILTAAHCITASKNPRMYRVAVGDHTMSKNDVGEQVLEIAKIIVHEDYNHANQRNDFALMITSKDISFASSSVAPACLPSRKSESYTGWTGTISGWGRYNIHSTDMSDVLKIATVTIDRQEKCFEAYRSTSEMFCASAPNRDTCQGDSGGPLTVLENGHHTLIGVTSFGRSCALREYPGVYARVPSALDWLERKLGQNGLLRIN